MKIPLRLKAIRYNCDFRKADWRLYQEFERDNGFPGALKPGECYLFISGCENQLLWLLNQQHTENSQGFPVTFTDSRRWRFSGTNKWDPTRLRHFAELAGIELVGIRSFDGAYKTHRVEKRAERQERIEKKKREAEQLRQRAFA